MLAAGAALGGVLALRPALRHGGPPQPAAVRLELAVQAPDGSPAAGAAASVRQAGHALRTARADAQGRVRLQPLVPGPAQLQLSAAGAARVARALRLRPGRNTLALRMQPEAALGGAVVDDSGAPLPGVQIEARTQDGPEPVAQVRSDAGGRFRLGQLAAGRYAVQARLAHHELAVLPAVVAPATQPLRIVLQRTATLSGQVLDVSGQPAAGATVTVAGSGVWPPKALTSDAGGRFELTPIPAGVYELRATRGTLTSAPREGVLVQPAAESRVVLELEPGARLLGRVVDAESGDPLGGVRVVVGEDALTATPISTQTDARGEFTVEALRHLPQRLWLSAPGYVAIVGALYTPRPERQEITLRRAAVLSGQVVGEHGEPIAGAELEVTGTAEAGGPIHVSPPQATAAAATHPPGAQAPAAPASDNLGVTFGAVPPVPVFAPPGSTAGALPVPGFASDADGRFRIEGVPAGRVQVVARLAGYAPGTSAPRRVRAGQQLEGLRIELPRGGTLAGRVLDAQGQPVAAVRLQIEVEGERAARTTLSGQDGRFLLEAVRGKCVVTAFAPDAPALREQTQVGSGERRELLLRLASSGRPLLGRVHDARGFPIEGARIRVEAVSPRSPGERSAISVADGSFRVEGLAAPPYRIVVEHEAYAPTRMGPLSPGPEQEVSIELRPGARVWGTVIDAMTNEGVANARVTLRGKGHARHAGRTDTRGKFEFKNLIAGKYSGFIGHSGYVPERFEAVAGEGETRELDPLPLHPAGLVSGAVVDRLGAPVFDAEVALGDPPTWGHSVRSDRHGVFRLQDVAPGERTLSARHPQAGASARPTPVRVYPRQESPGVVLRLPGTR